MSDNVDNRVVRLTMDNKKFEKSIAKSTESLEKLKESLHLEDDVEELEKVSKRAERNIDFSKLGDNVQQISDRFSAMGIIVKRVFENIADSAYRAGTQIVKSLSVEQIYAGFGKYERKAKAVQTIKSATGLDVDKINNYLDDLNKYTDETSYDFTDMVNNIGKFTSAGVEMKVAVESMKGIGNWAAKSGAGINEASRAMYNLSQALAQGSVKLMDWKSIESANMATKEFKETVIDTAVELGTLKKSGDKITTKKGTAVDFKNFSQTLSEAWFTTEVLTKSLDKYADVTTEFGLDAFHAAQQAVTFSDALNAVKDAAASGWMHSFEYIFGTTDEAIQLFTDSCNAVIEVINAIDEARNNLLKGWKERGGRTRVLEGLTAALEALWNIVKTIRDAWNEIIPPITVDRIVQISKNIEDWGKHLKTVLGYEEKIKKLGRVWIEDPIEFDNEPDDPLRDILNMWDRGDSVKQMQERLNELGFDSGVADGIFGPKTQAALKAYQKSIDGLEETGMFDAATAEKMFPAVSKLNGHWEMLTETTVEYSDTLLKFKRIFAGVAAAFSIFRKGISFIWGVVKAVGKTLAPVGNMLLEIFGAIADKFVAFNEELENSDKLTEILKSIEDFLSPIQEKLEEVTDLILKFLGVREVADDAVDSFTSLKDIWSAILKLFKGTDGDTSGDNNPANIFDNILSHIIESFDKFKEWVKKNAVNVNLGSVLGIVFGVLASVMFYQIASTIATFRKIAKNVNKVVKNIKTITTDLKYALKSKFSGGNEVIQNVLKLAAVLAILAAVVYVFSKMSWGEMAKGFVGATVALGLLVGFLIAVKALMKGMSRGQMKNFSATLSQILPIAISIGILAGAFYVIGNMSWESIGKGFVGLAAVMALLWAFLKLSSKIGFDKSDKQLMSMLVLSATILVLVKALQEIAAIPINDLIKGLAGLGLLIAGLIVALKSMGQIGQQSLGSSMAVIGIVMSFAGLIDAIKKLGEIEDRKLIKGMLGFFGLLAGIVVFSRLVGTIGGGTASTIVALAVAMNLLILPIKILGKMDVESLAKGVAALGVVMLEFGIFMRIAGKASFSAGTVLAMIPAAISIGLLAKTLKNIVQLVNENDAETIVASLAVLGAVMLAMALLMKSISKIKPSFGAILGVITTALSIRIMASSLNAITEIITQHSAGEIIVSLGMLALAMFGMSLLMKAVKKIKVPISAVFSVIAIAISVRLMATSLRAITEVVKSNSAGTIVASLAILWLSVVALGKLMTSIKKIKVSPKAVFSVIAIAGSTLLMAAALWAITEVVKNNSVGTIIASILMLQIAVFMLSKTMKSIGKSKTSWKGVIGVIAMAAAMAAFALAISTIVAVTKSNSALDVIKATALMSAAVLAMSAFFRSLSKSSGTWKDGLTAILRVGAMVAGVYLLAIAMNKIVEVCSRNSLGNIIKSIILMKTAVSAITLMAKTSGGDIKTAVGSLITTIAAAGLLYVLAMALERVSSIDPSKILSFCVGFSTIILSLSIGSMLMAIAGPVGVGVLLLAIIGIIGVIAGVVAAFGALSAIPGFANFMNRGAATIGGIIGSFQGAISAQALKTFNSSMKGIGELEDVDEKKVDKLINTVSKIADLSNAINSNVTIGTTLYAWLTGGKTPFASFCDALPEFADGMKKAIPALGGSWTKVKNVNDVTKAIKIAGDIAKISNALDSNVTIGTTMYAWLTGKTPFKSFCGALDGFGSGVATAIEELSVAWGDTKKLKDVNDAITVAQKVADISNALSENTTIGSVMYAWLTGKTPFKSFCEALPGFGSGVATAIEELSVAWGDTKKLKDVNDAITVAQKVADISNALSENTTIGSVMFTWLTGKTPFKSFCGALDGFGAGVKTAIEEIGKIPEGTIPKDISTVLDTVKSIADITSAVEGKSIGSKMYEWMTGETPFGTFVRQIPEFVTALVDNLPQLATMWGQIKKPKNVQDAIAAAQSMADLASGLDENVGTAELITRAVLKISPFKLFLDEIPTFVTTMSSALTSLSSDDVKIDNTKIKNVISVTKDLAELAQSFGNLTVGEAIRDILGIDSPFVNFCEDLSVFGTKVESFAKSVQGISATSFGDDSEKAVSVATRILDLGKKLEELDDGTFNTTGKHFWETSDFDQFTGSIGRLGTKAAQFASSIRGLSENRFVNDSNAALTIATQIYDFAVGLQTLDDGTINTKDTPWWQIWQSSDLDDFSASMKKFGKGIADFDDYTKYVDAERIKNLVEPFVFVSQAFKAVTEGQVDTVVEAAFDLVRAINETMYDEETGIELTPTITPILDLSSVESGIDTLNGYFGYGPKASEKLVADIAYGRGENGGNTFNTTYNDNTTVTVTGNTFAVREEADIRKIAIQLAAFNRRRASGVGEKVNMKD